MVLRVDLMAQIILQTLQNLPEVVNIFVFALVVKVQGDMDIKLHWDNCIIIGNKVPILLSKKFLIIRQKNNPTFAVGG